MVLWVSSVVLLIGTVVHTIASYRDGAQLDAVSGAWAALAEDLVHGTFYRPLLGNLGWGGTRAFPLYFSLHALAMRSGMSLISAGYLLSAVSGVLAVSGAYLLLRRLAVSPTLGLACAMWVLAPLAAQKGFASFHPDLLAAGLAAWGLGICLGSEDLRSLVLGSLLFALAFAAKMTAVSAPAAVFLYWIISRKRLRALQLAIALAILYAAVLATMQIASRGRALSILFASGGASLRSVLLSGSSFWQVLLYEPVVAAFLVLAVFVALTRTGGVVQLGRIWFACTLALTVLIYSAPGASTNHFLELHLAGVVLVGAALAGRRTHVLAVIVSGVVLFAGVLILDKVRTLPRNLDYIHHALQTADAGQRPILAENPLLPILAGQRPQVIDPFMLNLVAARHPEIRTALRNALLRHRFGAVILDHDPDTLEAQRWYATAQFGRGFVETLQQNYVRVPSSGPLIVFKPR